MRADAGELLSELLKKDSQLRTEWEKEHKLRNDPRLTRVGRFLRKTSLDELPQLWNVLRGEMSLVGPRPIVDAEVPRYREAYDLYRRVKPGMTGFWQVSGRSETSYKERVEMDTYYVRNWSGWLDIVILARTVSAVLCSRGAI
jgi:lipopolysaccharide/colanic/teichoic acid biosynthesis glycosyltransferase